MFNLFELLQDYEKERMTTERYNDKEATILEKSKIEEEDAEDLLNEVDLDFESQFDTNLLLGRRKQSSANTGGFGFRLPHKLS